MVALDLGLFFVGGLAAIFGINGLFGNKKSDTNRDNDRFCRYNRNGQYMDLKNKGFDTLRTYVVAARSEEDANRILLNACKSPDSYSVLGPSIGGEGAMYFCCDELLQGFSLYTFVLKKGIRLDMIGVYKVFPFKVLGQIEGNHWAVDRKPVWN